MRHSSFLALLVCCLPVFAQGDDLRAEAAQDCDKNQLTMNTCAQHRFEQADRTLNRLFRQKLQQLETPAAKERLRDAQRAWIAFRDKDCLYNTGPREESGSIWPLLRLSCMERHTAQRVEALQEYVACTQDGCPH